MSEQQQLRAQLSRTIVSARMCDYSNLPIWLSAVLALIAAYYWYRSGRVSMKRGYSVFGETAGQGIGHMNELADVIKTQSRLSATAAFFAAVAAVVQSLALASATICG